MGDLLCDPDERSAIRTLRRYRGIIRSDPTLANIAGVRLRGRGGRPRGSRSLDSVLSVWIAMARDMAGLRPAEVLRALKRAPKSSEPAPFRWLKRRYALGKVLMAAMDPGELSGYEADLQTWPAHERKRRLGAFLRTLAEMAKAAR